jgi:tetratricopeptide (TPR) repeat protein/fumarate reductase subunit C
LPPTFQPGDNPFAFIDPPLLKFVNLSYIYFINFWILLAPDWLCFDWAFHCIRPIETGFDFRVIFVILFYILKLVVCFISLKRNDQKVLIFISFLIIPFLPATNLIFTVGFVVAERNLYLSVVGHAAIIVVGLERLQRKKSRKLKFAINLLLVVSLSTFAVKSCMRSFDWCSEHQLYSSGLKVCPNNPKVYYNIAKLSADSGATSLNKDEARFLRLKAVAHYKKAIELWPDYEQALNNLGNLFRQEGKNAEAKQLLLRALKVQPKFPACWMNLGVAQANLKEYDDAEFSYVTALKQRKNYPDCHYNLGTLYLKTKSFDKAIDQFLSAIRLRPNHFAAWSNLIILLDNLERFEEAKLKAETAIQNFPEKPDFYFHLANLYGKTESFFRAEAMYEKAIEKDATKAIYFVNLGVLYHRWKKFDKAAEFYKKALALDPKNEGAWANLQKLQRIE